MELRVPHAFNPSEDESRNGPEPEGPNAIPGPAAAIASGFGGLGLEGIMLTDESLGEGNRGVMSGDDDAGSGEEKLSGNKAGAAEITEAGRLFSEASDDEKIDTKMVTKIKINNILLVCAINDEEKILLPLFDTPL
ncbi:beta carbonic anhydrase 4 [Striga asiatica]|uniref:Beta carbonic anhydrase 4 n=1 Tax=Striga asiatica TaxID=4170 RepID=A0A5A7QFJ8_STRAF|nr:beta carbonic anhydrase 4 [Striga asiatica]